MFLFLFRLSAFLQESVTSSPHEGWVFPTYLLESVEETDMSFVKRLGKQIGRLSRGWELESLQE